MKTSELKGAMLDYWVAKADEVKLVAIHEHEGRPDWCAIGGDPKRAYQPSTYWTQGGPLIEKYKITCGLEFDGQWFAEIDGYPSDSSYGYGPTLLEAVCRCIVRDKFGAEVRDLMP